MSVIIVSCEPDLVCHWIEILALNDITLWSSFHKGLLFIGFSLSVCPVSFYRAFLIYIFLVTVV